MTHLTLTPTIQCMADELGSIDAEIKRLTAQRTALADELKSLGAGSYAGSTFKVTVAYTPEKTDYDWRTICEKLNPSSQMLAAHKKIRKGYLSATASKI